jgi:Protein of unknown function (DUF3379)
MICLDFRRDALAQPLRLGEEALAHARECQACREFLERQRVLDAELFDVLSVPAPDGLADRILLAGGRTPPSRWWFVAMAATLVFAVGLASFGTPFIAGNSLAREAIAHVHEEPQSFTMVSSHAPEMLPAELATQGLRLAAAIGEVTYARFCPMASGTARHIVVKTASGPVTLFLMPDDARSRRRTIVGADGMTAITMPTAHGNIAIVAASREGALAVERALVRA